MTDWPRIRCGLNPYGLTYHLGLQGAGTPRANPNGKGLEGFLALGDEIGAEVMEIFDPWLQALGPEGMARLRDRLAETGVEPVISGGLITGETEHPFVAAKALGATKIRYALTNVLCGARAERPDWDDMRHAVVAAIRSLGPRAADAGLTICIENHQDFTSRELADFCTLAPGIGITYDTGNSFPVGEAPLDFTRTVAPHVAHVHLKDYNVQMTPEGFRLVRCAIGDGAVPFAELFAILGQHCETVSAVLEPGALEARHVKLFTPTWWHGYAPRAAETLAACLLAAQVNPLSQDADYRTPWERGADAELEAWELAMIRKSAANMKTLGIL